MVFTPIQGWDQIAQTKIFPGESGGDYNALFGFSNRPGGRFAHIQPTRMTVGQMAEFTKPSGEYAQWVKSQIGRVATPTGAYQAVGTTMRAAMDALGLDPNTPYDKATQDRIGQWIYATQGPGAWEGWGKGSPGGDQHGGPSMAMSSMGGPSGAIDPMSYMLGGADFPLFDPGPTKRDRLSGGLVAAGEAFTSLGAGSGPTFEATDAFLRGESARRAMSQAAQGQAAGSAMGYQMGQEQDAAAKNATASWLAGQGPKGEALAQAVASGSLSGDEAVKLLYDPEAAIPGVDGGIAPTDQKDLDKLTNDLRSSVSDDVKILAATDAAINGLREAALSGNPMDTRTMVTLFSKLIDPTTGVLGGEAAATLESVGFSQSLIDLINREAAAGGLTVKTRQMMLDAATRVAEVRRESFIGTTGPLIEYAVERGVDPRALGLPEYYNNPYTAPTIPANPNEVSIGGGEETPSPFITPAPAPAPTTVTPPVALPPAATPLLDGVVKGAPGALDAFGAWASANLSTADQAALVDWLDEQGYLE